MTAQSTLVRTFMTSPVRTVREDAPLGDAYAVLCDRSISCLGVVDGANHPVGVISRTAKARRKAATAKKRPALGDSRRPR